MTVSLQVLTESDYATFCLDEVDKVAQLAACYSEYVKIIPELVEVDLDGWLKVDFSYGASLILVLSDEKVIGFYTILARQNYSEAPSAYLLHMYIDSAARKQGAAFIAWSELEELLSTGDCAYIEGTVYVDNKKSNNFMRYIGAKATHTVYRRTLGESRSMNTYANNLNKDGAGHGTELSTASA